MAERVLVMGATGNVGGATLAALREAGVEAVAFVRNRDRAAEQLGADQPVRVGDLADKRSVAAALEGIERVLLCSGNDPGLREQQLNAVEAIAASDVRRIVKISASAVATRPDSPPASAATTPRSRRRCAQRGARRWRSARTCSCSRSSRRRPPWRTASCPARKAIRVSRSSTSPTSAGSPRQR